MNISYTVNFTAVFLSYDLVHNTDGLEDFPRLPLPGLRGHPRAHHTHVPVEAAWPFTTPNGIFSLPSPLCSLASLPGRMALWIHRSPKHLIL